MDPSQYSFDPTQQGFQRDGTGYQEQNFFGEFEHADECLNNPEFMEQACLAQPISSWNQAVMQRFLKETQREPVFNPLPSQILALNPHPVESLPPVSYNHRQSSPFSSQELSSCSSTQSPRADTELFTDSMPLTPPNMAMFPSFQAASFEFPDSHSAFLSAIGGSPSEHDACVSMTEVNAVEENTSNWNNPPATFDLDFSRPSNNYTFRAHTLTSHHDITSPQSTADHEHKHTPSPDLSTIVKKEISLPEPQPFSLHMSVSYPTPSVRDSEGSDVEIDVASPIIDDNDDYNNADDNDDDDEDDEDGDYKPENKTNLPSLVRRTPRNKRSAPKPLEKSLSKRTKLDYSASSQLSRPLPPSHSESKGSLICTECSHSFKDEATLQSHVKKQHTRPFICVFRFAGCASTFASKNEWKRHVMSQHLVLHYWLCDIDVCAHNKNSHTPKAKPSRRSKAARRAAAEQPPKLEPSGPPLPDGAIFNRKDLYTQHIRRMHTPVYVDKAAKASKKGSAASFTASGTAMWDEQVKDLQNTALRERCKLPTYMHCPAPHCTQSFSGADAWDQRMEHVARHLERAALGIEEPVVFGGPTDPSLMEWVTNADVAVVRSLGPGKWVLNNPLRAASEGRGVGRKREVLLDATASPPARGSSAVSPGGASPLIKNEIFVDDGEEDAEGEEE